MSSPREAKVREKRAKQPRLSRSLLTVLQAAETGHRDADADGRSGRAETRPSLAPHIRWEEPLYNRPKRHRHRLACSGHRTIGRQIGRFDGRFYTSASRTDRIGRTGLGMPKPTLWWSRCGRMKRPTGWGGPGLMGLRHEAAREERNVAASTDEHVLENAEPTPTDRADPSPKNLGCGPTDAPIQDRRGVLEEEEVPRTLQGALREGKSACTRVFEATGEGSRGENIAARAEENDVYSTEAWVCVRSGLESTGVDKYPLLIRLICEIVCRSFEKTRENILSNVCGHEYLPEGVRVECFSDCALGRPSVGQLHERHLNLTVAVRSLPYLMSGTVSVANMRNATESHLKEPSQRTLGPSKAKRTLSVASMSRHMGGGRVYSGKWPGPRGGWLLAVGARGLG